MDKKKVSEKIRELIPNIDDYSFNLLLSILEDNGKFKYVEDEYLTIDNDVAYDIYVLTNKGRTVLDLSLVKSMFELKQNEIIVLHKSVQDYHDIENDYNDAYYYRDAKMAIRKLVDLIVDARTEFSGVQCSAKDLSLPNIRLSFGSSGCVMLGVTVELLDSEDSVEYEISMLRNHI